VRICVVGGSGFVGSNLVRHLQQSEPDTEIVIADTSTPQVRMAGNTRYVYADVRDLHSLIQTFQGCEEVYHLAGILGTSELLSRSSLATAVNVTGANNVLDAAVYAGVQRVYNVAKPHFDSLHENAYTLSKNAGELLGLMYREKFGLKVSTIRWLNAVGPYQHLYPVRKLVPALVLFALSGVDLEIYGDGSQTIDPIDARDMARFTVYACRNMDAADVVDLGSGEAITCNDAARVILDRVNTYKDEHGRPASLSEIVHSPMREGEKPGVNLVADMSYWDGIGMKTQYSFTQSVDSVIHDIASRSNIEKMNGLSFYGKTSRY
jgi:UDP-glucose 4-epimerase